MNVNRLMISNLLWKQLIKELRTRGKGKRETGAFLLGPRDGNVITEFICYDDLDSHAFDTGIIVFDGDGFIPLWKRCTEHGLKVLADVHTHPGSWIRQSSSDRRHPMIVQAGHIALIVPRFAQNRWQRLKGVGVYEFLGEGKWKVWEKQSEKIIILR